MADLGACKPASHGLGTGGEARLPQAAQPAVRTQQREEAKVGGLATVVACLLFQRVQAPPQLAQKGGTVNRLSATA